MMLPVYVLQPVSFDKNYLYILLFVAFLRSFMTCDRSPLLVVHFSVVEKRERNAATPGGRIKRELGLQQLSSNLDSAIFLLKRKVSTRP
jgi:hypothetical protein